MSRKLNLRDTNTKTDMMKGIDAAKIREDFPILKRKMSGKRLIYLDSAATSQKPESVINAIDNYYRSYNSNIHRGLYRIAEEATEAYTGSKEKVAKLINAGSYRNIVYCRNTTEAINMVALSLGESMLEKGDVVLTTEMEHHSNIVPWQMLAKRKGSKVEYARLDENKKFIDMEDYKSGLEKNPKIVTFTAASNVLGTINDIKEMTRLAHKKGAVVVVDGAQHVPHMQIDVGEIGCDFLAFSGHKMFGPAGIGVLYGKEEALESMEPVLGGGDMIRSVSFASCSWNELPWKFEAGTSNIEGGIGLGAAVDYMLSIGMGRIREHEEKLTKYALESMADIHGVKIFGPALDETSRRGGTISFNVDGIHPHDLSTIFDSEGIAIRAGHHCAMPLVNSVLGQDAVARISFYAYNSEEDVDALAPAISKAKEVLRVS